MNQIPEDWNAMPEPLDAAQAYSVAKRVAEHLTVLYHEAYGLETIVARCFAFVGQDLPLNVHFAIGNFIHDALYADIIQGQWGWSSGSKLHGPGGSGVHWLWIMLSKGSPNRAYNVGSDEPVALGDLAHRVRDLLSPEKPVLIEGRVDRPSGNRNVYVPSIQRAKKN